MKSKTLPPSTAPSPPQIAAPPPRILAAFACVYFFWGSTYAAIHVAGLHLAPSLVGASRTLLTTLLLLVFCLASGRSLRITRREFAQLAIVGVLFMSVNSILLTWAETMVPSGIASLLVSTMPIMVALLEAVMPGGEALNRRGWAGTLLGTVGIAALVWPSLRGNTHTGPRAGLAYLLLLLAALAFAVGAVLSRRFHFRLDPFAVTAWQVGAAAVCNTILVACNGSLRTAVWTTNGVLSVVYLSVFGSLVGLSCLAYLLQHVPVTKVSTYAFVNPIVAVLLGVVLFGEHLAFAELVGMATIVAAVALVIYSRVERVPTPPAREDATLGSTDAPTR